MITCRVKKNNANQFIRRLLIRLTKLGPVLKKIGSGLSKEARQSFSSKKDPAGNAWASWSKDTEKQHQRAKKTPESRWLLVWSGNLKRSIFYAVEGNKVIVGSNSPYGIYHELGTSHMPSRPFLGIANEQLKNRRMTFVKDLLEKHINRGINE